MKESVKPEVSVADTAGHEVIITTNANNTDNVTGATNLFVISGIEIGRHQGLHSLTDLWRAAGRPTNRRPKAWLENTGTKEFFDAVGSFHQASGQIVTKGGIPPLVNNCTDSTGGIPPVESVHLEDHLLRIHGGPCRGIYVSELPLLKYAAWVGPWFELLVYDVYKNTSQSINSDLDMMLDTNVDESSKTDYINNFTGGNDSMTISEYAALIATHTGRDVGPTRILGVLRKLGYLKSGRTGHEKNQPHQSVIAKGWFGGSWANIGEGKSIFITLITKAGVNEITMSVLDKYNEIYGE